MNFRLQPGKSPLKKLEHQWYSKERRGYILENKKLRGCCTIVTLFTSNDKFEERGFTIITFQDSQAEISEFTSKLCNPSLVILNCNNNFTTYSSWYTGQKHLRSAKQHPPQILYLLYYLGEFYTLVPIEIIHLNPYWMPPNQVLPSRLSTFWCTIVN